MQAYQIYQKRSIANKEGRKNKTLQQRRGGAGEAWEGEGREKGKGGERER
jgi:hypothetical protein